VRGNDDAKFNSIMLNASTRAIDTGPPASEGFGGE
jgi:hypothetical protein